MIVFIWSDFFTTHEYTCIYVYEDSLYIDEILGKKEQTMSSFLIECKCFGSQLEDLEYLI